MIGGNLFTVNVTMTSYNNEPAYCDISRCRIFSDYVDAFDVNYFMAGGIPEYISIAAGTVMKYNHIQLNLRDGYNSSTGTESCQW